MTDADLVRCHLVLIGTEAQNSVVARIARRLPVRLDSGAVTCDDGVSFPAAHPALGLVHYNPLAPDRLVFWVGAADPEVYAANSLIPELMAGGAAIRGCPVASDLLVQDSATTALPVGRSFDSAWKWLPGRDASVVLPPSLATYRDLAAAVGRAIGAAADADFAIVGALGALDKAAGLAGVTRVCDVSPLYYNTPIGVFELTGAELQTAAQRIAAAKDSPLVVWPAPAEGKLVADRRYRIALPADSTLWNFGGTVQMAPASYRLSGQFVDEALDRWLARQ